MYHSLLACLLSVSSNLLSPPFVWIQALDIPVHVDTDLRRKVLVECLITKDELHDKVKSNYEK